MGCIYFETVLNDFVFKWVVKQNNFPPLSKALWSKIIAIIVYYFQIWNKKEHNIIIIRVICSHMAPMYIETPYT